MRMSAAPAYEQIHHGQSRRALPPPAVHAQPEPPVANCQPIGRCELIVLVPAGVFFELIRGRIDQLDRLEFDSCLVVRQIPLCVRDQGDPAPGREKTSWVVGGNPGPSGSKRVALKGRRGQVA